MQLCLFLQRIVTKEERHHFFIFSYQREARVQILQTLVYCMYCVVFCFLLPRSHIPPLFFFLFFGDDRPIFAALQYNKNLQSIYYTTSNKS